MSRTLALLAAVFLQSLQAQSQNADKPLRFDANVSSECQRNQMIATITTDQPFSGIVHTIFNDKNYRNSSCSVTGNGQSNVVVLRLNLNAKPNDDDYCGIIHNKKTDEKKVAIIVRRYASLETAEDKPFTLSCQKPVYKNARYETSQLSLNFLDDGSRVIEVYHGRQYTLRAETSKPDGVSDLQIVNCSAFGTQNQTEMPLIDSRGCPVSPIITKFTTDESKRYADATIFSMFKYPDSRNVFIQCIAILCAGKCPERSCLSINSLTPQARTTESVFGDGAFLISASVYVLAPGEESPNASPLTDCSIHRWSWLLGLCIAFGVLFVIMLIINIFLCSALTCTCTRQEIIEKEPSIIEDYDPYKTGWGTGSQYGSRYSLHGKPGYTSGGSTLNSTTRSMSTNSDHYAIVHSHPGSRYSTHGSTKGGGPGSTLSNGQYNHAYNGRL